MNITSGIAIYIILFGGVGVGAYGGRDETTRFALQDQH